MLFLMGQLLYLEGAMAKYKPGDYEFDMPAKLIELYNSKDYGSYAENAWCLPFVTLLPTILPEVIAVLPY